MARISPRTTQWYGRFYVRDKCYNSDQISSSLSVSSLFIFLRLTSMSTQRVYQLLQTQILCFMNSLVSFLCETCFCYALFDRMQ